MRLPPIAFALPFAMLSLVGSILLSSALSSAMPRPAQHPHQPSNQPPITLSNTMSNPVLSNLQSGETIDLTPGETLTLRLNENPTTGYRWLLPDLDTQQIQLIDDRFELPANSAIGASGQRILTLKALAKGTIHLTLHNRQAWDPQSPIAESFTVKINVTPR